uniref:receptor protein serine/threonine kinase n=1 Tax=Strigamia maritima TaxID=126957 RepID=T1J656_STRMM
MGSEMKILPLGKMRRNNVLVAVFFSLVFGFASASELTCAYMYREPVKEMPSMSVDENGKESEVGGDGEILSDNKTVLCPRSTYYCYALWQEDPQNKNLTSMLAQGCWESSDKYDCESSECVAKKKPPKAMNNTKFCCCSGASCNINVTDIYVPTTDAPEIVQPAFPYKEPVVNKTETVIISVICSVVFILTFIAGYRVWSGFRKPSPDSLHVMESSFPPSSTPTYDLTTLKLQEIIGRGRYGSVWKAKLNDKYVAAKVFPSQHRQYYLNEKDIYTLPYFEHFSLPKFLGSEERVNADGRSEYLIVMTYAPYGCLQDYLRSNVIDWTTLCKMSQSVAKGLAHLHDDIRKGDKIKPCISHRDLNSRNVLVREDLSCFICDMGFAMKLSGSKYYGHNGEEQYAETTSLTDVGTLRYMAPEVLEGAVNLRDCETSLKQIDVYSLGLVLWEIMTRCEDLYQGLEVPEYRLPFEAEIGLHPSFEQMQVLISKNKARPLFSDLWKDTNQAVRLLKETIEDCWDPDADARLTSLCVDERLQELPILWERHKMNLVITGVSPTVNPTSTRNSAVLMPGANVTTNQDAANIPNSVLLVDLLNPLPRYQTRPSYQHNAESSTSEATVETIVTTSPSEPLVSISPNVNECPANKNAKSQQAVTRATSVPLQPYQGRNPCLERNMIMEPLDEVSISGNTLLEKGSKFKNSATVNNNNNNNNNVSSNSRDVDVDNIFEALQTTDNVESNSLISNDVLNQSTRTCNPIPYVQNAVHGTLPTRPKQPNVPGNGQHYDQKPKKGPFGGRFDRKKNPGPSDQKSNPKKSKDWGIKSFLERKRTGKQNGVTEEADASQQQQRAQSLSKSNLVVRPENRPVATEVCLLQQNSKDIPQTVTRPTNGPYKSIENGFVPNGSRHTAEVGVAHLAPTTLQNGQAPVIKHRSSASSSLSGSNGLINCHSETDLLNTKVEPKLKRPTTLPLKGHWSKEMGNGQVRKPRNVGDGSQNEKAALLPDDKKVVKNDINHVLGRAKITKRVKTPFKMKTSRFSLVDDRMMCASEDGDGVPASQVRSCISLPIDIDSVDAQVSAKEADADCKEVNPMNFNSRTNDGKFVDRKNSDVLKNGLVVNRWKNDQFKATDSGNDLYQVSCL